MKRLLWLALALLLSEAACLNPKPDDFPTSIDNTGGDGAGPSNDSQTPLNPGDGPDFGSIDVGDEPDGDGEPTVDTPPGQGAEPGELDAGAPADAGTFAATRSAPAPAPARASTSADAGSRDDCGSAETDAPAD